MPLPFRLAQLRLVCLLSMVIFSASYATSQTFTTTGSMAEPLICQTATPLHNNTILIAGGTNSKYLKQRQMQQRMRNFITLTPGAQTFVPTGSLNVARGCGSNATLLNDGTVLITGGSGNTTAELYNPSSNGFGLSTPPSALHPQGLPIGPMTAIRYNATATLLQDGTVLIAGGDIGNNQGSTSAEIYNPATGTFTATTGAMSTKRTTHTATLLRDGTVLIAGGQGNISGQAAWNTAEIYKPSSSPIHHHI